MHDWRKAIRAPVSYSIPGASSSLLRQQTNFVTFVIITGILLLTVHYMVIPTSRPSRSALDYEHGHEHVYVKAGCECDSENAIAYNRTYPLTPIETLSDGRFKYQIATVADLDKKSRTANKGDNWFSYILRGHLIFDSLTSAVEIDWEPETQLNSDYAAGGRGMELSDLVIFNGKLFTCDDRTGIVYEVHNGSMLLPWVILRNGNGENTPKGFKCEWMTVKDDHLYVGGLGKEWTTSKGVIINNDPQWVKRVSVSGHVEHQDWRLRYIELRRAASIEPPGYLIHESAVWSNQTRHWYFLPRRASQEAYDDALDEQRGTNILLTANSDFSNISKSLVGRLVKTHGFSSVKLLPLPPGVKLQPENSEIGIALKSEEDGDVISTYVTVFRLPDGHILLPERQISSKHKYEGIEFV